MPLCWDARNLKMCTRLVEVDITPPEPLQRMMENDRLFKKIYSFNVENCPWYDTEERIRIIQKCAKYEKNLKDMDKSIVEIKKLTIDSIPSKRKDKSYLVGPEPGDSKEERKRKHRERLKAIEEVSTII